MTDSTLRTVPRTTDPPSRRRRSARTSGSRGTPTRRLLPASARHVRGAPPARAVVGLARAVHRRACLLPVVRVERLRAPRRLRHGALHAARARPERRRRLGRPARPRLRRVLRDRRVRVRAARLRPFGIHLPSLVVDPDRRRDRRGRRVPARPAVETPDRRLPRDRDALLPAALPDDDDERRPLRSATTSPAAPNGILQRRPARTSSATTSPSSTRASSPSPTSTSRSAFFAVVFVALRFVNHSRTGRAWRSLREDPLAAEVMGMPVNWLKLLSFSFGAAVAALTGTLFASLNASVFPLTFYFVLLITVYTMVILGGSGSQAGVVARRADHQPAARDAARPGQARVIFYVVARRRPRVRVPPLADGRRRRGRDARVRLRRARDRARDRRLVGRGRARPAGSPASSRTGCRPRPSSARWIAPVTYIGLIAAALARDAGPRLAATRRCSCRRSTSRRSSGRT